MKAVFRIVKEELKTDIKAEFLYNDDSKSENMQKILDLLNENRKEEEFVAVPVYLDEKNLSINSYSATIDLLVRIQDDKPDEILGVDSDNIYTIRDLLNQENTDKTRYYDVFQIHGSYKQ